MQLRRATRQKGSMWSRAPCRTSRGAAWDGRLLAFWLLSVRLVSPCARRNGAANGRDVRNGILWAKSGMSLSAFGSRSAEFGI